MIVCAALCSAMLRRFQIVLCMSAFVMQFFGACLWCDTNSFRACSLSTTLSVIRVDMYILIVCVSIWLGVCGRACVDYVLWLAAFHRGWIPTPVPCYVILAFMCHSLAAMARSSSWFCACVLSLLPTVSRWLLPCDLVGHYLVQLELLMPMGVPM